MDLPASGSYHLSFPAKLNRRRIPCSFVVDSLGNLSSGLLCAANETAAFHPLSSCPSGTGSPGYPGPRRNDRQDHGRMYCPVLCRPFLLSAAERQHSSGRCPSGRGNRHICILYLSAALSGNQALGYGAASGAYRGDDPFSGALLHGALSGILVFQ